MNIETKDKYLNSNIRNLKEDSIFDPVNLFNSQNIDESDQKVYNSRSPLQLRHLVDYSNQMINPIMPKNLVNQFKEIKHNFVHDNSNIKNNAKEVS